MALPVDTSQSDALNLQVLQRQDDQIMDIVGTASHVVVYEFNQVEQSWKRKEVEGSLFVVKRYSAPRFQIFVNNRLSTVNMAIAIDAQMNVDNVDDFLIIRCTDAATPGEYKIYGIWFYPEEDRQKTLKLLERVLVSIKGASNAPPAKQPAQPQQQRQQAAHEAQTESKPAAQTSTSYGPIGSPKKNTSTTVLSKAEGIAAGEAILGMISQNQDASLAQATEAQLNVSNNNANTLLVPQQRQKKVRERTPPRGKQLNKEQFKEALLQCLEDPAFVDQIYQAYSKKQQKA
ncbi:unnamed protein product [Aphanomyces euteiches]|uniref:mRNA-decapping enzyme C-terminal domain-containing protein n=1 Tax=Aphanomyces euteiches TaxID=100861 RepID=A0A6G0XK18_9STRA|nr:hypothetical protein Ae201684_004004 [Aphanomyces euteiches]KAH9138631.1 hypothetical protein AeRB84_017040 [Aphanomyces euteiches]